MRDTATNVHSLKIGVGFNNSLNSNIFLNTQMAYVIFDSSNKRHDLPNVSALSRFFCLVD